MSRCFLLLLLFTTIATVCAVERGPIFKQHDALQLDQLPNCRLKEQLARLPAHTRNGFLRQMQKYGIGHHDLNCLHADSHGKMHYQCSHLPDPDAAAMAAPDEEAGPTIWENGFTPSGSVPISAPPIFNSHPGSSNVLYLDFNGDVITDTAWNNHSIGSPTITARSYDIDGDHDYFSNAEQTRIYQVWQRVAEDFAAFDINVTTDPVYDDASNRGPTIGQVLITHNGDFNNDNAGGRAYVGVFGFSNYATYYSPALVYYNKLSSRADYIAEATSHEMGHNLGLSHDGTSSKSYYNGHGSGQTSWGPIMGTGYNRNVSQWSNGEYYDANNSQDDEARLLSKLGYRNDDHGDSLLTTSYLYASGGTNVQNTHADNRGIINGPHDPDVFAFITGAGSITLQVDPFVVGTNTRGGNLDVQLRLLDHSGTVVASANPASTTGASVSASIATAGTYYLEISAVGTGTPESAGPSGYVDRFSQGQYFISGTLQAASGDKQAPSASVTVSDVLSPGGSTHDIHVTFSDNVAIDVSSLDHADVRVTGPNAYNQLANFISVDIASDGTPRQALYRMSAPGGTWNGDDNGDYSISIDAAAVTDTSGNPVPVANYAQFLAETELAPDITSTLYAYTDQDDPFNYSITADHNPTSFSSSSLPSGLSLNTSNGVLSGTPSVHGTFNITITASNAYGSDSETLRLTIYPPEPEISSALTAEGYVGAAFNYDIVASNSPTYYNAYDLPAGLGVDTKTGKITGTPSTAGTYTVTLVAYNGGGGDSAALQLTIHPPDNDPPETSNLAMLIRGQVSVDTVSLTLNGISASMDASGYFTQAVPISDGAQTITIIATDVGGRVSSRSIDVNGAAALPPPVINQ